MTTEVSYLPLENSEIIYTKHRIENLHTDYRVEQRCRLGALSRLSQCSVEYSSLNDLISQLGGLLFAARQYTLRMPHTQFGIFLRF